MGLYPDPPAERMPYDKDGTVFFWYGPDGVIHTHTAADKLLLNDETNTGPAAAMQASTENYTYGLIFPQLRDLKAWYIAIGASFGNGSVTIETSTNTTTGQDGTWTSRGSDTTHVGDPVPSFRTPTALVLSGIRAIRWNYVGGGSKHVVSTAHLYGKRQAGTTPVHALDLWHATIDQALSVTPTVLDLAEVARSGSASASFRVKNISPSQTAHAVVVSLRILTDASPTLVGQIQFSSDAGATWANTISLGDLASGAISGVIQVRYSPSSTAELGLHAQRIEATATSFS